MPFNWIKNYDCFFFDFDGLLVETEELHWKAYQRMCECFGYTLPWDFNTYCSHAHRSSTHLQEGILNALPELKNFSWITLYEKKQAFYLEILETEELSLMEGAESFLLLLLKEGKKCAVVTHSRSLHVTAIKKKIPLLLRIHNWITREDYKEAKPAPDCYLLAENKFSSKEERKIGFEDSLRGVLALQTAGVEPILVCAKNHPQLSDPRIKNVRHFTSLLSIDNIDKE